MYPKCHEVVELWVVMADLQVMVEEVIHRWAVVEDSPGVTCMVQDPPQSQVAVMHPDLRTVVMAIAGITMDTSGIGILTHLFLLQRMVIMEIILIMEMGWNRVCVRRTIQPLSVVGENSTMAAMDKKMHLIIYLFSR